MIFEAILSAHLAATHPTPVFAATTSYRSSGSISRSYSRSYGSSSVRRSSSAPTRIRLQSSTPRIRVPSASSARTSPTRPQVLRSSTGNIVVNRQIKPSPAPTTTRPTSPRLTTVYTAPSVPSSRTSYNPPREVVRERYVERDSGVFGNPFFWMWMSESVRNDRPPVVVQSTPAAAPLIAPAITSGAAPTPAASPSETPSEAPAAAPAATQAAPSSNSFFREVAVFALGAGIMVILLLMIQS